MRVRASLFAAVLAASCGQAGPPPDAGGCDPSSHVELASGVCAPDDEDDDDDGALDEDDCAPLDPARAVDLVDGSCVADDADDDDDGAPDESDCAPRDPRLSVDLATGACAADDGDDDDDGAPDEGDCAPLDPALSVELASGGCRADDADDDDDGAPDESDCAPRDPERAVERVDGSCVADDEDDDDDGVVDGEDCAPLDASGGVELSDGSCAANDEDDDDDGVLDGGDCAPADAGAQVMLADGSCVADDEDDDDDGVVDGEDCASLDSARRVSLATGSCVADDEDDDDDGALDAVDCAPLDPSASVVLVTGACVADDADDDDDGALDAADCAPLDAALSVPLVTGACVPDDADDDDDGVLDASDCAPREAALSVTLASGVCVADDADDDDDGTLDADDCAPLDAGRQITLRSTACVADDADDDDDGALDGGDCSPRDARYSAGPCSPGDVQTRACGLDTGACVAGERTRTCTETCYFDPWSDCGGAYVAPATELCGTSVDEDCDGAADEGCGCSPAAAGSPGSFAVAGDIQNLRADPARCLAYAVDISLYAPEDSAFVVFDTRLKAEVVRIPYGHGVTDFDVSPDGARIAIARYDAGRIDILEPPVWTPSRSYAVGGSPHAIEIGTMGRAWYARGSEVFVLDLATGASTRVPFVTSTPRLELSPDETAFYVGAYDSGSTLYRFDVGADGSLSRVERSEVFSFIGFARGQPVVSPDGTRLAWAGTILDAFDLRFLQGRASWHLDTWDAASRFMVAGGGVVDAERVRGGPVRWASESALLVSADQEVWWHDAAAGRMHYANIGDFVDPALLGRREWPPLPIADYDFTSIVVDPVRPWLYAVDGSRGEVVVFDRGSLTPLTAIEVGIVATDAAIDPSGRYLYAGHYYTWGVARVDLDELTYAGLARTHVRPTDIVALRPGRVVAAGDYSWQSPALIDAFAGTVLDQTRLGYFEPALAAGIDGTTMYLAESGSSSSCLFVFDTSVDVLTETSEVTCLDTPPRGVTTIPTTTDVFWALTRRSTTTGAIASTLGETIVTVTPDARLAISETAIYDAATGARRASLPVSSAAQALSPDARTLYLGVPGAIRTVSLAPYLP